MLLSKQADVPVVETDHLLEPTSPRTVEVGESSGSADRESVTVIRPPRGWQLVDLRELWRFRELLYFLIWRDVKVRYKQTVLGAAWAVLQPLMMMVVFTIFFSRLAGISSGDIPYPVFVFAGLLPWTFFANAISTASGSVVGNQHLVTKIYFPRLCIPLGAIGAGLVDFTIAFGMLLVLMLFYGLVPNAMIFLAPLLVLGLVCAAVGVGALLSALTVAYRDFRYVMTFLVQMWMFATPSIYLRPDDIAGSRWHTFLPLNPAYGLIANFRLAMLGGELDWYALGVSCAASVALLLIGCLYFRRVERNFADII
jgi:lipopolysaccharide transport system permease protein